MSISLLQALTNPRAVALIGASDNRSKLTARPQILLEQHGFRGRVFPVNPVRSQVLGKPAFASLRDLPVPVDHAYVLLDAVPALEAVKDCAAAGVPVVTLLADGFAEAGLLGQARQKELAQIAREAGILLIGPNSTGVASLPSGFICTTNAAFRADTLRQGRTAVLSQSGSLIGMMLSRGDAVNVGFSTLISVGNEAGASVGDFGKILLDDPETDSFILFLETLRDRETFAEFAREAQKRGKPIVAYVLGRSEEGQALSVSHTGAITGGRQAMTAYLDSLGIHQVDTVETLLTAPLTLARTRMQPERPRSVTVVSTTGGGGGMVLDQISARGVRIAGVSPASRAVLEASKTPIGHGKLVDVTLAGTKYDVMRNVIDTLRADPETGLLVVAIGSSARFNPELAVKPIIDSVAEGGPDAAPVVTIPLPDAPESLAMLDAAAIPAFRSVETCAEIVAMLLREADEAAPASGIADPRIDTLIAADGMMDEVSSGDVIEALGLRRPGFVLIGAEGDLPDLSNLRFPVVAKLVSADLPHKSEAGAIRIGLGSVGELQDAITAMRASAEAYFPGYRLRGVLVQEMRRGVGEVLLGLTQDPLVGPVLTVAAGGVTTEIYKDAAVRPAPVTLAQARRMINEVRGFAILKGFRGGPRGDLEALAEAITAFSQIALYPRVLEAEVNPLLVHPDGEGTTLLDALIRTKA